MWYQIAAVLGGLPALSPVSFEQVVLILLLYRQHRLTGSVWEHILAGRFTECTYTGCTYIG